MRSVALKKLDDKILAITSRELVAAEARYHNLVKRPIQELKALSHLDVLASVWQGLKMYVKRWHTLDY